MSGTSLDGIDGIIADFSNPHTPSLLQSLHHEFPPSLNLALRTLQNTQKIDLVTLGEVHTQLGEAYAHLVFDLLEKAHLQASDIAAIGNHGQTIFHQPHGPSPFTLQIGNQAVLAARTQIPVVGDFRSLDLAYGGEGAPLVPLFLQAYFASSTQNIAFLNLGGIANISVFQGKKLLAAFDTGPGNGLMDEWTALHFQENYDRNGSIAASGQLIPALLNSFLSDAYFQMPYPKSTGREYFSLSSLFSRCKISHENLRLYTPEDVLNTLTELTAQSITQALASIQQGEEIVISGGGTHNLHLISRLKALNPKQKVISSIERSLDPQIIEPLAFAWLAKMRIENHAFDLKAITNCKIPHTLGVISLP